MDYNILFSQVVILIVILLIFLIKRDRNLKTKKTTKEYLNLFIDYEMAPNFYLFVDYYYENGEYIADRFDIALDLKNGEFIDTSALKGDLVFVAFVDYEASIYAFWNLDKEKLLTDNPVVYLGAEGYLCVIANNFNELLQILSIDNALYFYEDEESVIAISYDDNKDSENKEYLEWLKNVAKLQPIENSENILKDIVLPAYNEHQLNFLSYYNNL